ncbi:PAS domain S-box protein [Prosthecobacter sp.]|uniref:PAS domain S-box protein n=1 Tax=Prosthecobacter sp. TaxID=1965333 RepID=UPI003783DEB1
MKAHSEAKAASSTPRPSAGRAKQAVFARNASAKKQPSNQDGTTVLNPSNGRGSKKGARSESALQSTASRNLDSNVQPNQFLFDHSPVGYAILDPKGRIEQINAAAALLLGRDVQDLRHIGFASMLNRRKDRELLQEHLQRCGTAHLAEEKITTELQLHTAGGQVKLVQLATSPAMVMEGNCHLIVITDVTSRLEAEEALRGSEGRMASILDALTEAVISVDENQRIVLFNAAAVRMFRLSAAEVRGQALNRLFHPGQDCSPRALAAAGAAGEIRGMRADGSEFPIEASISPPIAGSAPLLTLILRDISELRNTNRVLHREYKERQRLEHEITEISERERRSLGQALHDGVCQHLSGVGMMAATLSDVCGQKSDDETADKLREIASLIRSATNDARDVARGLNPVDVDANGLVTALRDLAARYNVPGQTRYVLHCHEPVPVQDNGIAVHLYRIVQEAVVNASRHARARNISIHLGIRQKDIMLSITDDGIGLPADIDQNTGLGLKLMRYRASSIGATLTLEARSAGGTVVRCRLPSSD